MTVRTIDLGEWYTKQVAGLKLGTHEVAKNMSKEHLEVPFSEVTRELKKEQELADSIEDVEETSSRHV
jgi:hypothetical protein